MPPRFALLVARQRSGTGALNSVLSRHAAVEFLGEVFHPGNVGKFECYFEFEKAEHRSYEELVFDRIGIFERYLEHLRSRYEEREVVFFDAKYNSTHHLRPPWSAPADPPHLVRYARDEGWPIVHLTRRNLVHVYVSGRLADLNQIWHARESDQLEHTSLEVDIDELLGFLQLGAMDHRMVQQALDGYDQLLEVDYTELFDENGALAVELAGRLADLLRLEPFAERGTDFVKQVKAPLSATIDNYDSVVAALGEGEFGWMLEQ